eukprot:767400-Hanusia_phi.AAC.3
MKNCAHILQQFKLQRKKNLQTGTCIGKVLLPPDCMRQQKMAKKHEQEFVIFVNRIVSSFSPSRSTGKPNRSPAQLEKQAEISISSTTRKT